MARDIVIKIKTREEEFKKFKRDYEALEKRIKKEGLNVKLFSQSTQEINQFFTATLQGISSISLAVQSIRPISDVLGIAKLQNVIYSLGGIASGINAVRTAATKLAKAFGWVGILISAGSLIYDLGKRFGYFREQVKLANTSLQVQVDLISELRDLNDEQKQQLVGQVNELEELRKVEEEITRLLNAGMLSAREQVELEETLFRKKKERLALEEKLAGIGAKEKPTQKDVKAEKNSLTPLGTTIKGITDNINRFKKLKEIDVNNAEEHQKSIDAQAKNLYNILSKYTSLSGFATSTIEEVYKALKAVDVKDIKALGENVANAGKISGKQILKGLNDNFAILKNGVANLTQNIFDFLDGDFTAGMRGILDTTITAIGDILEASGDEMTQMIGKTIKLVWSTINSILTFIDERERKAWEARDKKIREDGEKRVRKQLEKEKKIRDEELKIREKHTQQLKRNFQVYEQAFTSGVIGIRQFIRELRDLEVNEKKGEIDKYNKEIEDRIARLREEGSRIDPRGLSGLQKEIADIWREYNDTWGIQFIKRGRLAEQANELQKRLDKLKEIEEEILKKEREKKTFEPTMQSASASPVPMMMAPQRDQGFNVNNLNIQIKTIVDPADPKSLKRLTDEIINQIKTLKITGGLRSA